MRKPTVLGLVSVKVFPTKVGGQKYIADYYAELAKHTQLILAVSRENQVDRFASYKAYPILFDKWLMPLNIIYFFKLCYIIRKWKINTVMIDHTSIGWMGILLKWVMDVRLVIKSARIEAQYLKEQQNSWWDLYDKYEGWIYKNANRNFFISEELKERAINRWNLISAICGTLPYGIKITRPVLKDEHEYCRAVLLKKHQLTPATKLFFFNGSLNTMANKDALYAIMHELAPRMKFAGNPFKIIISGYHAEDEWIKTMNANPHIIFLGYVFDIGQYYKGTDCFICPVSLSTGNGIKPKIIEAIANGLPVISFEKNGEGLKEFNLGNQLVLIKSYDWNAFADAMTKSAKLTDSSTPANFYSTLNWPAVVQRSTDSFQ